MKRLMLAAAVMCVLGFGGRTMAADVAGTYVLKTEEATSVLTAQKLDANNNMYRIVIDAKTPLLNDEHTMHASLFEGQAPLRGNLMEITFRATGEDPSDMRDPERSYTVEILFGDNSAQVKEIAGHRDAILNTPFGSVEIQGRYSKEAMSAGLPEASQP